MSPVATCGVPCAAAIRFACVPFPDPWGPKMRILMRALFEGEKASPYLRKPS
jgi:hypothetical protein